MRGGGQSEGHNCRPVHRQSFDHDGTFPHPPVPTSRHMQPAGTATPPYVFTTFRNHTGLSWLLLVFGGAGGGVFMREHRSSPLLRAVLYLAPMRNVFCVQSATGG